MTAPVSVVDLGDTVPFAVEVRDAANVLVNASTCVLTITLPDGTTTTPTVANPSTGNYTASYVPTQEGRHVARWVSTVPNTAYVDAFDVRPAAWVGAVSLAAMKDHLQIPQTTTTHDEKLRGHIAAATAVAELKTGLVLARRSFSEVIRHDGCGVVVLTRTPVLSVTTVTPVRTAGAAVTVSDLDADPATGIVRSKTGTRLPWGDYRWTYVAGVTVVPDNVILAVQVITRHLWETQRGAAGGRSPMQSGEETVTVPGFAFAVPRRAVELLEPDGAGPLVG